MFRETGLFIRIGNVQQEPHGRDQIRHLVGTCRRPPELFAPYIISPFKSFDTAAPTPIWAANRVFSLRR